MAKVGDYIRVIGENIEGVVYKTNSQYLVGKYKRQHNRVERTWTVRVFFLISPWSCVLTIFKCKTFSVNSWMVKMVLTWRQLLFSTVKWSQVILKSSEWKIFTKLNTLLIFQWIRWGFKMILQTWTPIGSWERSRDWLNASIWKSLIDMAQSKARS